MQTKTTLSGAVLYAVRMYTYKWGQTYADIQVLDFGTSFGSQAVFRHNEKGLSSGRTFPTEQEALQDIVDLIEAELK